MKKTTLMTAVRTRLARVSAALAHLSDETAVDTIDLFPTWRSGEVYAVGDRVQYGEKLYKVVQAHTSQADWTPDIVPALFVEVAKPGEIPVWVQPTGAHDTYNTGDRVHYPTASDPVYESTVDNNSWAPNVYGWVISE